ncbi:MAG: porphobilinogen synthase [Kiritimatiellaeota bacterium]|nr:porphobilinogen synthase [Kiritimatiellota bacterium]
MSKLPETRLRRLRRTESLRTLTGQPFPTLGKMIWPVFAVEGENQRIEIGSMPGQFRMSADELCRAVEPLAEQGLGGLMLFGVVDEALKDAGGSYAFADNGLVQRTVKTLKAGFPDLTLFTDVCLCGYTDHGHCGALHAGTEIDNDKTLVLLQKVALSHAAAGADGVAPSAMMDGQVAAIRRALETNGYTDTVLMSYSTKFASALYGPFREAAESSPQCGDRKAYQLDPSDPRQALRESKIDEEEGADILMVKPATFYLDVISKVRENTELPLAAYNVSGEYAMIHALANSGGGDLHALARENLAAIQRAGADMILTYWANQYEQIF